MSSLPKDRPAIMGILNVTPDSFSDGGQFLKPETALARGLQMIAEGADIIDVGGESTRPGAEEISVEEELRRVIPVIESLRREDVSVSIDTRKPLVAQDALKAGAKIVNDVGGLREREMRLVCADADCKVCIMHMQGEPKTMQRDPQYDDVVKEVREWLLYQARLATNDGIAKDRIWIDPGIGFGKSVEQNLLLLKNLREFVDTAFPVMVGVSRKSFIGKLLGNEGSPLQIEDRLEGGLALQAWAQLQGVRIIRTHDVKASRRAAEMLSRLSD